jgi:hypothetical protein
MDMTDVYKRPRKHMPDAMLQWRLPSTKEHILGYEHILSYYSRPLGDTKRISEKAELHPHFFIPWRGQC